MLFSRSCLQDISILLSCVFYVTIDTLPLLLLLFQGTKLINSNFLDLPRS